MSIIIDYEDTTYHRILFITCISFGQENTMCDTIYSVPETPPKYPNDAKGLMNYSMEKLTPILSNCMQQDEEVIGRLNFKTSMQVLHAKGN
jgi:hypothetical protein